MISDKMMQVLNHMVREPEYMIWKIHMAKSQMMGHKIHGKSQKKMMKPPGSGHQPEIEPEIPRERAENHELEMGTNAFQTTRVVCLLQLILKILKMFPSLELLIST